MRLLFLTLACAAVTAWPAAAAPPGMHHETARSGTWSATFSYLKKNVGGLASYANLRLTVSDGTAQVYDAPVVSRFAVVGQLQPGGFDGASSVSFRDLDGDGTPELLLALYTGGAHCCFLTQVVDLAAAPPRKREIDFADAGARLIVVAGHPLFRTNDPVFAYAFTDFADSGSPIKLWSYTAAGFRDVTRTQPALVRRDAATWWTAYRTQTRRKGDVRGLLAAWAADEALLGRAAPARTTLNGLARGGRITVGDGGPKGAAYVRQLWRFLARHGYLRQE